MLKFSGSFHLIIILNSVTIGLNLTIQIRVNNETSETTDIRNLNKIWMYMPDGDGQAQVAYLMEPEEKPSEEDAPPSIQVEFNGSDVTSIIDEPTIIPRINVSSGNRLIDVDIQRQRESWDLLVKQFNPDFDTKIIVHGWKSSIQSPSVTLIKEAYNKKKRLNIFAIDWKEQASSIFYLGPVKQTLPVGKAVAKLIDYLVENMKADPRRIHLIGFSLGAHVMGYAGSFSHHRVGRITGLDPAAPGFELLYGPTEHLDKSDADFVDIIHTSAGLLGFLAPIGHLDFYPNGGIASQPGCSEITKIFTGCSHGRAYEFFAESINSEVGFHAMSCSNHLQFDKTTCRDQVILMGEHTPRNASNGIYYLQTASSSPYALGSNK